MAWPENNSVTIESLALGNTNAEGLDIKSITLLGSDNEIAYKQTNNGLEIANLGEKKGDHAFCLEITLGDKI